MKQGLHDFAEELCAALDAQLEQQARLLAVGEAQTRALVSRDVGMVEALTRDIETTLIDARAREARRAVAATNLAHELGIDPSTATLATLTDAAPAGLRLALRERGARMTASLERVGRASVVNRCLIEGELAVIDRVVRATRRAPRDVYSPRGNYDERVEAFLDATA